MLKKIKGSIGYFFLALSVTSLAAGVEGYVFILMSKLYDAAINRQMTIFKETAFLAIAWVCVLVPLTIVLSYTKGLYKKKAIICLKKYYIEGLYKKNINEFQKDNNMSYLSALTNDFNTLELNFIDSSYQIGECIIHFAVGIWMMMTVNPWIILLAVVIVSMNIGLSTLLSKPVAQHTKERSDLFGQYTGYIKEVLSAFQIIKSNNLTKHILTNFEQKSAHVQQKGYIIDRFLSFIYAAQNGSIMLSYLIIAGITGYMILIGQMTIGGCLLIIQALEKISMPLATLSESVPKLFTIKDLVEKLEDTLKNKDTYEETLEVHDFRENILFQDVDFGYEEDLVLNKVNLEIEKGGKYLIIGPSGGGKSTLLKLLRKYFNPIRGSIMLDDKAFKDIQKQSYFELVANIEQQVFLFEDTLRNNITLYKSYTEEEIEEAVEKAGLRQFILNLPQGLDTMLYENGKNISGGEKSRVVIARGLLSKASIIFLDEAFASLDMENAKKIEENLLELEDTTIINVSHVVFEETKKYYDKIFVVKNGTVKTLSA